ncbi:MAG: NAD(P)/FAD-dependent oxidoreductase [Sphaerochaeta sp.]|nr:NAD(P)/FAD-dependent oxidoreductase [Sphaerochaeta sp.]
MRYDVVVVGGGIAGLTAASYCARENLSVLLCEKQAVLGGTVNSFERDGFVYDLGIRSIENSGIVFPMLRQLGIELEFSRSLVSVGVADQITDIDSKESLDDYADLLKNQFPGNTGDIDLIMREIRKTMGYMDVLYGIDNPLLLDSMTDITYMTRTLLPWSFRFLLSMPKVAKLRGPVNKHLAKFTTNQALIDIIAQHFFKEIPASFALSYFSLYLDYHYPKGGTRAIPQAMEAFLISHGGSVLTDTTITHIDSENNTLTDQGGNTYSYNQLIWAADSKALYRNIKYEELPVSPGKKKLLARRDRLEQYQGGDSIFALYLAIDLPPSYFSNISHPHLFYTPSNAGIARIQGDDLARVLAKDPSMAEAEGRIIIKNWLAQFLAHTTYELSCPAMRDASLAPEGQSALMVSTLFDYRIAKHIKEAGWYDQFKLFAEDLMVEVLCSSLYPEMKNKIVQKFSSTPLTFERETGNSDGTITGWAYTKRPVPVPHAMRKIMKSAHTPVGNIFQAGQWTFSPSGLPISVLTGKLAADKAIEAMVRKNEKKKKNTKKRK